MDATSFLMPRTRLFNALLVCLAVLLLFRPALVNGYPLLFPDTLDYVSQGHAVLYALLHTQHPVFGGMRSALYALAIYPFHLNRTPWPVLLLHAAVVVYPVCLTVRVFSPRRVFTKATLCVIALCALTALPWYISLLMPDVLGAGCYLALFLLGFARTKLSRAERELLTLVVIVGATAHTTHLLLGLLLCIAFALIKLQRRSTVAMTPVLVAMGAAVLLQLAINALLFGHASLDGNRPPYLEARVLADGPGAQYLQEHCPDAKLTYLCAHTDHLPPDDDEFLWSETGLYATAPPDAKAELLREERPLALAVLRTYPTATLRIALRNFAEQLISFGLDDFDNNDYMQAHWGEVMRGGGARYDRSLQARDAVPWKTVTVIQDVVVVLALLLVLACWRGISVRLRTLCGFVLGLLLANAALTGVLSEVDSRYQARIVWLLPFAAVLCLLERSERRTA